VRLQSVVVSSFCFLIIKTYFFRIKSDHDDLLFTSGKRSRYPVAPFKRDLPVLTPTLRDGLKSYAIGPKIRAVRLKKKMGLVRRRFDLFRFIRAARVPPHRGQAVFGDRGHERRVVADCSPVRRLDFRLAEERRQ
jgi:hypothetical protein